MGDRFHMVRFRLNAVQLLRTGHKRGLTNSKASDMGYLVHCAVRELFQESAPAPFAVTETIGPWLSILGYGPASAERLRDYAGDAASEIPPSLDPESLISKPMPTTFPKDCRLAFRLRACPVVRKSRGSASYGAGAEVDAYLSALDTVQPVSLSREEVYLGWLSDLLTRSGGQCEHGKITEMSQTQLMRRDNSRKPTLVRRPDVLFEGVLRVTDPGHFALSVRQGLGRHKAFGFGMLLLKR